MYFDVVTVLGLAQLNRLRVSGTEATGSTVNMLVQQRFPNTGEQVTPLIEQSAYVDKLGVSYLHEPQACSLALDLCTDMTVTFSTILKFLPACQRT